MALPKTAAVSRFNELALHTGIFSVVFRGQKTS